MTTPAPKLTAVTLGVRDVPASARFYEALGFKRKFRSTGDEIAFFDAGGMVLALWDWAKLAEDSVVSSQPRPQTFRGATFAWNCETPAEVDLVFAKAIASASDPIVVRAILTSRLAVGFTFFLYFSIAFGT